MRFLKKLGKEIGKVLPVLGTAVFSGHPVAGPVMDLLGITPKDSEEEALKKLTPEALSRLEELKLEQEYKLAELDLKWAETEMQSFAYAQENVREMARSESAFTRNAVPAAIWVWVLANFWEVIGFPTATYMMKIFTILFAADTQAQMIMMIDLPVIKVSGEFSSTIVTMLIGVFAKRSYDQTEIVGKNFTKKRKGG